MNQSITTIKNVSDLDDGSVVTSSLSELTQQSVWGAHITMSSEIVATHQELAILRQCAAHALGKTNHVIHIISSAYQHQTSYLVKTLIHFGVSCGQLMIRDSLEDCREKDGVWIFVVDTTMAC